MELLRPAEGSRESCSTSTHKGENRPDATINRASWWAANETRTCGRILLASWARHGEGHHSPEFGVSDVSHTQPEEIWLSRCQEEIKLILETGTKDSFSRRRGLHNGGSLPTAECMSIQEPMAMLCPTVADVQHLSNHLRFGDRSIHSTGSYQGSMQ